mgnify:CR=1 FL=1
MIIGILACWANRPEWTEEHGDFADWFPPFLRKVDATLEFKIFHAHQGHLPTIPTECDAWLITGSGASVYEDLPWQSGLATFLRNARGIRPMIGVCYGHQLLHSVFGGKVEKASGWGIGVHSYDVLAQFGGASQLRLIASHQDQVTQAAVGSEILASSAFCPIASTQIGSDILTIQPHPEMTPAQARAVFAARRETQGREVADIALASLDTPLDDKAVAVWMVAFLRDAQSRGSRVA